MNQLVIYCADIGSITKKRFGWARLTSQGDLSECSTGCNIELMADSIARDLNSGSRVALGFECPLYVPVPLDPERLTSARPGEGDRPWSAGAGCGSLATGLTQSLWVLERVKSMLNHDVDAFLDWATFEKAGAGLFLWEAFVTKGAKAGTHHGDAELAVKSFHEGLPNPESLNAVTSPRVRSLIGAALLQSGWLTDFACLARPCLVVRAKPL